MCKSDSLGSFGGDFTNSWHPSLTSPPAASTESSQIPFFTFSVCPTRAAANTADRVVCEFCILVRAACSDFLRSASARAFFSSTLFFWRCSAARRSVESMSQIYQKKMFPHTLFSFSFCSLLTSYSLFFATFLCSYLLFTRSADSFLIFFG